MLGMLQARVRTRYFLLKLVLSTVPSDKYNHVFHFQMMQMNQTDVKQFMQSKALSIGRVAV